ncbi:unnamed protein product [Caenorhabditis sp. 36 PRJEB53466]|nr:unnamed protein product [Caenorhabditis sp. 36 PRJEB53466]
MQEERSRSSYRPNLHGLSSYYRERFGSHSPEEYLNLRISGFDDAMDRDEIKQKLTHEFRKYAPFEIKVVKNPEEDERLAYVNFERKECARKVRYTMMERLKDVLGKHVQCDPAGILRDQEGKYIPDRFNRAQQGDRRDPGGNNRSRPTKEPSTWRLKQDDDEATRTLFVGNMPSDVKEREIRSVFEKYGKVEEVDIKTPINTDAAYAFVMFTTVDQAIEAKNGEQNEQVRIGGSRMKIGYGKSQVSRKLIVGGLNKACDKETLQKVFGSYGFIDDIEYSNGSDIAYIVFENTHQSQEACRCLRGQSVPGSERPIMVDYAKDTSVQPEKQYMRKRRASRSPVRTKGPRTPPGSPKDTVHSFEELDESYAATWSGKMALKKKDYLVKFYRVYGAERLVVNLLRDEDDAPLHLNITQRLSLNPHTPNNALYDKLSCCTSKELSLGVICGRKNLEDLQPLVNYFTNKDAAGVANVPGGMLYIFPYSDFALRLLKEFAPQIEVFNDDSPFLLGALAVSVSQEPGSSSD